ncbi:MAG: 1-hydroxycarotenoid 3,4-desaturase CrtD [Pseudomonadota bacterium]
MNQRRSMHVIVIGAGIGGLSAALDLASRGIKVSVLEQAPVPGGKMREIIIDDQPIDSGPTVFTMRWVFENLFKHAGTDIEDHLELHPCDRLARHAWTDGSKLDLYADRGQSADAIAEFADPKEAQRYLAFCKRAKNVYDTLYDSFMRSQRPSPWSLMRSSGWSGLLDLWRIQPFQTLWKSLGKSFRDPRLQGLFGRYATYCGSSPLLSPATLMLIAHVEQCGVWRVQGGMQRLAEALADRISALGGSIHYRTPVRRLLADQARAYGVELANGDRLQADALIANTDVAALQQGELGPELAATLPARRIRQRSLSAITFSMLAAPSGMALAHHNVFFPANYPKEFKDIFEHDQVPHDPAVYVCAQPLKVNDDTSAHHSAKQRLFMITNAPASGDHATFDRAVVDRVEASVFSLLSQCGLSIDGESSQRVVTTPADFEARFPGTGGALYGASSHGWRASFSRTGSRSKIKGLYPEPSLKNSGQTRLK